MAFEQRKSKDLACACGEVVKSVDSNTVKVICWRCVNDQLRGFKQTEAEGIKLIFQDLEKEEKTEK